MQNRLLKELGKWATIRARRSCARSCRRCSGARPTRKTSAHRAAAVCARARGQRRAQDPHHPRLLRAAVAALSAGGAGHPAFRGARRAQQRADATAAFDAAIARAADESDSALGRALAKVIALTSEGQFRQVVDAMLGKRAELARMVAYHRSPRRLGRGRGYGAEAAVRCRRARRRVADRGARRRAIRREIDAAHRRLRRPRLERRDGQEGRGGLARGEGRARARAA